MPTDPRQDTKHESYSEGNPNFVPNPADQPMVNTAGTQGVEDEVVPTEGVIFGNAAALAAQQAKQAAANPSDESVPTDYVIPS